MDGKDKHVTMSFFSITDITIEIEGNIQIQKKEKQFDKGEYPRN